VRLGATPGKKIMRLRVVPEGDPVGRIDLNGALMRLLGYLVNGAISWFIMVIILKTLMPHALLDLGPGELVLIKGLSLAAAILPYLLILGAERRALEDKFSRSIVIRVDR
jgi:hypothetical protein